MKPLVSILIPAYNAEEWIADTLRIRDCPNLATQERSSSWTMVPRIGQLKWRDDLRRRSSWWCPKRTRARRRPATMPCS